MRKLLMGLLVVWGMIAVNVMPVFAQDDADDKFSFGKVVSVAAPDITVKEYDFAKDADVETVYTVTAETEFGNVNAVTELAPNDDVVIDYAEKDGKRMVITLVKEDKSAEAPAAAEAVADAPAAAVEQDQPVEAEVAPEAPAVVAPEAPAQQ